MSSSLKQVLVAILVAAVLGGWALVTEVSANTKHRQEAAQMQVVLKQISDATIRVESNQKWIKENQEYIINKVDKLHD